jgi:hypothetical protein
MKCCKHHTLSLFSRLTFQGMKGQNGFAERDISIILSCLFNWESEEHTPPLGRHGRSAWSAIKRRGPKLALASGADLPRKFFEKALAQIF